HSQGLSLSFSPDGSRLAAGWIDGSVELWDVPGRKLLRTLTGSQRGMVPAGHVAFSPGRHLLAATSETNTVSLYDFDSGRESVIWRAPSGEWDVRDLEFSSDGSKLLIYAGADRASGDAVWVIDASSGAVQIRFPTAWSFHSYFGGALLSPDNR